MATPLVITHPASYQHRPPEHPERPERIAAIEAALDAPEFATIKRHQVDLDPESMTDEARHVAYSVHQEGYVDTIFGIGAKRDAEGAGGWVDADTFIGPGSLDAASASVLSAREAVSRVLDGETEAAFSFCRPPGHHATRSQAMGFCFFNNAAAAAQSALSRGLLRVAIIDFDVHHGNGTQDIFYGRSDVLYVSTHQWPLYPGTGAAEERGIWEGEGFTLNLPLPARTGDSEYLDAFDTAVLPALDIYAPELLVVSAGFDAHARDPLAELELTTAGFGAVATRLLDAADRLCGGRSAWILEGGYDLDAVGACAAGCVRAALRGA